MDTQIDVAAAKESLRRRTLLKAGAIVSAGLAALFIGTGGVAHGQVSPLEITALAKGLSLDRHVDLKAHGPNDVLFARLVFQPGADTGWHVHPGPVVVVVSSGTLTEETANGCLVVHPAGTVFYEQKDEVHRAFNRGGTAAEVYATFIMPIGAQPLIPASDPGRSCRAGDDR